MKIKDPLLLRCIGRVGAGVIRCWMRTLRVRVHSEDPAVDPRVSRRGYLYCLWHETLLMPTAVFSDCGIHLLISQHRDGEYITRIVQQLGFVVARGSTTRGAVRAVRELSRSAENANLAITPDGPRGPRRVMQNGAVYLASRGGLAIVPIGFAFERAWRASSWDRFVLPRPFSKATCYIGHPIVVPRDADVQELAEYHKLMSEAMDLASIKAELLLAEKFEKKPRIRAGRPSALSNLD